MYQSKTLKSVIREKNINTNKFIPLLKIQNDIIKINDVGLQILRKLTSGPLLVLAFEQQDTQIAFKMFNCFQLNNNNSKSDAGIWIGENVLDDDQAGVRVVGLIGNFNTLEDSIRIHLFHMILASVIVLNFQTGYSAFKFLKAAESRINYHRIDQNKIIDNENLSEQLANIVFLQRGAFKNVNFQNQQLKLDAIQKQEGLIKFEHVYRSASYWRFPQDKDLNYSTKNNLSQQLYKRIIMLNRDFPRQSKKLEYGPVLAQFLTESVHYYNSSYLLNFTQIMSRIQIDSAYQAYMQGLQVYTAQLKRRLSTNQPVHSVKSQLVAYRNQAVNKYKSKSSDYQYLMELNNTIDDKQQKIFKINDSMWYEKNVDILRKQSKGLIKYAENRDDTTIDVTKETQRIVNAYNSKAGGNSKELVLNGFLQKLNQTLGYDNYNKNIRISNLERQNKKMADRLKALDKKGCCAKNCQIM